MSKIRPSELEARLDDEDPPYVLDIRPRSGYQREHVPGSHNVSVYDDLRRGDDADLRSAIEQVPDGKQVVTVCKAGIVARKATTVLEEEGYEAATLAGGMRRWRGYQNGSLGYRIRSALAGLMP